MNPICTEIEKKINEINEVFGGENIFEIVGMGTQEIKHSNFLAWLFKYKIDGKYRFLVDVMEFIGEKDIYIGSLEVRREYKNIDLLLIDKSNKHVIAIENKVWAEERIDGEDGGQLKKYQDIVQKEFGDYKQLYIFLTPDGKAPNNENWKSLDYEQISNAIEELAKSIKNKSDKDHLLMIDYIKLLERKGLIVNKKVEEICRELWKNSDYRDALKAISNYKSDFSEFQKKLEATIEQKFSSCNFYEHSAKDKAIYTLEWKTYFGQNDPTNSEDFFPLEFGYYLSKDAITVWIAYDTQTEDGKAQSIWEELQKNRKTTKDKDRRIINLDSKPENYDGYNLDEEEVAKEAITKLLANLEEVNAVFRKQLK